MLLGAAQMAAIVIYTIAATPASFLVVVATNVSAMAVLATSRADAAGLAIWAEAFLHVPYAFAVRLTDIIRLVVEAVIAGVIALCSALRVGANTAARFVVWIVVWAILRCKTFVLIEVTGDNVAIGLTGVVALRVSADTLGLTRALVSEVAMELSFGNLVTIK
jgi:hypothetical protein